MIGQLFRRVFVSSLAGAGLLGLLLGASSPSAAPSATTVPNISGNWAGYVATGQGVTSVSGSWVVPNAGQLPPGASSTWVGIGGFSTQDLIQTGTQQISSPLDQFIAGGAYSAWYELLPAAPVTIGGAVFPGDHMNASVTNNSGNLWTITIADATQGWTYTNNSVNYASSESSAEWIHEAPTLVAVPVPVGGSGTVTMDLGSATIGGVSKTIGGWNSTSVVALPVETTVSALDGDADGFNVCTYALTCPAPAS